MANATSAVSGNDYIESLQKRTEKAGNTATEMQDRFLLLLTTQLRNQDPLNPLDNAEMTSQLAQINTVSGIEKVNATLSKMMDSYDDGQGVQAAGLIGKHVLVEGRNLPLTKGVAVGGVLLKEAADQVTVSITDSAGKVVATQQLGPQKAGNLTFAWDGATDDGTQLADAAYRFSVEAKRGNDKVDASPLQIGMVNAVTRSNGSFVLDLGTQGRVSIKDVQQIL